MQNVCVSGVFFTILFFQNWHLGEASDNISASCSFSQWAIFPSYSLTLIDALDTLAVMGNHSEFRRVANYLSESLNFDQDVNVSVFETNIRVVGGLLAAHLMTKRAGKYSTGLSNRVNSEFQLSWTTRNFQACTLKKVTLALDPCCRFSWPKSCQ